MHLSQKIRAGIIGALLTAGLANPLFANSQSMFSPEECGVKIPTTKPGPNKTSFLFKESELFLAGGTAFDVASTVNGLEHPTKAYTSDGRFLAHYYVREIGWAGFLGDRDPLAAAAANVALSFGVDYFSRRLYSRGGRWRALAIGTLLLKGAANTIGASNNVRDDERINRRIRLATGYQNQIVWR